MFDDFIQKAKPLFGEETDNSVEYKEILGIKNIKESELVINFKTVNEPASDVNNC